MTLLVGSQADSMPPMTSTKKKGRAPKNKGGARQKTPGGLKKILYVRAPEDLVAALDRRVDSDRKKTGFSVSRSDVARTLLAKALLVPGKKTNDRSVRRVAASGK
jgi:hypothetical protein